MGVPRARWMVYSGTSETKMDDDWGVPILGNIHMSCQVMSSVQCQHQQFVDGQVGIQHPMKIISAKQLNTTHFIKFP